MRILVAGRFASPPGQGGSTWAVLQYVLGLEEMGHDVLLIDPCPASPAVTAYLDLVTSEVPAAGQALLVHPDHTATGGGYQEVVSWAKTADILVNLGGALRDEELSGPVAHRVYVDLDPGYTQVWQANAKIDMGLAGHHRYLSMGGLLGTPSCTLPTCGVKWEPTLPPVVLSQWPSCGWPPTRGLTTVANWRSYGSVWHDGIYLGQKAHSFRAIADLPQRLPNIDLEPAIAIDLNEKDDRLLLHINDWRWSDAGLTVQTPKRYMAFVASSTAELGVAKAGYTAGGSGWFSDRSVCYLASGRPVIAQDTGWTDLLPHGVGLLAFSDAIDAKAAVGAVLGDYGRHSRAARDVAGEIFDARRVLRSIIEGTPAADRVRTSVGGRR